MNLRIDQLVKTLLKKDSINDCSLQELEQFASRHPYFGAAQLLLTKKLQEERSERYPEQLQKTFSFFNNPLWVQHLLNENGNAELIFPEGYQQNDTPSENSEPLKAHDLQTEPDQVTEPEPSLIEETQTENFDALTPVILPTPTDSIVSVSDENIGDHKISEISEPSTHAENLPQTEREIPDSREVVFDHNVKDVVVSETPKAEKEELLFEPFHTVDYFASQGIKMKEEEKPLDRFGKQLKSFTDWLKTMKKLPVADQLAKSVSPAHEEKVEQLAAHSLHEKEVITEAMAAVWEKQGNHEKAIEIYRKLSLLDPSKSVYFAAKIENLKK